MMTTRISFLRSPRVPKRLALLVVTALAAWFMSCSRNAARQIESQTASLVTAYNTITQAADETRTGWFPDQPLLDPATVGSSNFGRLFKTQLQPGLSQQVLAQPLVVGGKVLVVTEENNVYLVDALTGAVTNSRNLGPGFDASPLGCDDVIPVIGITGTPVVDVTTNTAYFYSKSSAGDWTIHAVSTDDLSERAGFPVTIGGSAQNDSTATFNSVYQLQRPGLLLMNGVVYAGFGSECDVGQFRGWIIGVTTSGVIRTMFTTVANTPNVTRGAGIWAAGAGLMTDRPGQILFSTGNGYGNPYANPVPGNMPPGDLESAVGRVVLQADGSLKTTDFYAPYDALSLSAGNQDVGSGGIVALPSQFGTTAIPHLALHSGKPGILTLLNRDNLGGFQQGPNGTDAVLAAVPLGGPTLSRAGVWPGEGGYVYVTVNGGTSTTGFNFQAFKYGTDASGKPTLTPAGKPLDNFGQYSGSPIVTSNGTNPGSALVWVTNLTGELRVYDAVPVNGVLNIRFRDGYGPEAKFTTPGVGAGAVYVGTHDGYLVGWGVVTRSVSGSPVAFGTVGVGQSKTLTATITANENVTVNALSSSSAAFVLGAPSATLPAALTTGQSISVPVTFRPTDTIGYVASLNVTTSSTPGALTMSGTGQAIGPHLAVSPNPLDFGGVAIGTSKSFPVSLSNNGTSTLTFSGITAPAAPFSVSGAPANGATLAPGTSTTLTVTFAPTATGTYTSSLAVGSNGGNVTVSLTGLAGTPPKLVVTPLNNDFGTVAVGTSKTLSFTLQNTGGVDLTISTSKPPALGAFVAQTSLAEGSTIAAGQTVTETVKFASSATGTISDVWQITGNDSTGLHSVTFTANSVAALPRTGWVATASATGGADVPALAIDSAGTSTRFSTGLAQSGAATQTFTLDMLSAQTFSMIRMDSGGDYARVWELYASDNPASWGTAIATGTATADPVVITFPTQTHRYLQIRQKSSAGTTAWWSIYDMNVYGITAPVSGPYLAVSPNPLDFGSTTTGTSKSLNLSLRNVGSGTLTFSGITAPAAPFSVSGAPANGATLAPGASTTLTVTFAPTADDAYTSSLAVGSDGGNVTVSLRGLSGTSPKLVVTPLNNDFGTVVVGTSKTLSFTLQNTGGSDLTILTSNPPALGPFVAQTSLPVGSTIAAGQTVTETVQFASSATGTMSDVWQIAGNDSTGPHSVTFTANSVAALPRTGWVATASATAGPDVPAQAIDSAGTSTRFSTGLAQSGVATQTFTLDMLSAQTFSMIRMDSGGDYARVWELYASDSPASWGTAIATGTATADPVIITFPTQNHRYLQIRQKTSAGTTAWWSIYDLNVYGSPNGTGSSPQLAVSPNSLDFGSITTGTSKSLNVSLSNTGTGTLTFSGITAPAAPFSLNGAPANGATLALGASTTLTVTFAPTANGTYTSSLAVRSDGGNVTVSLTGSGAPPSVPQLAVSPNALDFGTIATGTSKSLNLSLSNTGTGTLTFSGITAPAAPYSVSGAPANGATLAPGASTTMTVRFAPTATGTYTSSLAVGSDGGNVTVSLTGLSGAPPNLVVTPLNNDFGTVVVGTSKTLSFTLQNTGGSDLTISTSNPPALGAFVAQTSLPVGSTIAAGHTVTETVQFASSATGIMSDVWQIAGNDSTGPHSVTFTANSVLAAPGPLPRTGWVATASSMGRGTVPANAIDASTTTLWTTGRAQSKPATQWFQVDMQTAQTFNQIKMDSGTDYARNYQVFVSADGVNWGSAVATGSATATPVIVTFPTQTARFIQVWQLTSAGTRSSWSIYDLNVIAP